MTSPAEIDTLIALLHPHVLINKTKHGAGLPGSLWPRKDTSGVRKLAQAFATLFGYHPGCDSVAVTFRMEHSNHSSLYISLSPCIPHAFDDNVNKWLAQFRALHEESKSNGGTPRGDTLSLPEKSFILHTYKVCYPEMRRSILTKGFGHWDVFIGDRAVVDKADLSLEKKEHTTSLQRFSELIQRFASYVSRESLGKDEDILHFHDLCMNIRDMMSNSEFSTFLNQRIYCIGFQPALTFFSPPLALSTLLTLSHHPQLTLGDQWSPIVLCSTEGSRQFRAVIAETFLAERFSNAVAIKWKDAEEAFRTFAEPRNRYTPDTGYEWNAEKKLLSTARPVTVHPEIALIKHLVENLEGDMGAYIACSRTPCYGSVIYAGMVNETLGKTFTMDVDNPRWCQLYNAEPWILPEATQPDVMMKMKEYLLADLATRVGAWHRERWSDGYIASGYGDLDWDCDDF